MFLKPASYSASRFHSYNNSKLTTSNSTHSFSSTHRPRTTARVLPLFHCFILARSLCMAAAQEPETRKVALILPSKAQKEGAGVTIRRSIGGSKLDYLDPFLLLDEFNTDDV